jgi:DNA helicase HerA-like ATPase
MVTSVEMREAKTTASELREVDSAGAFVLDRASRGLATIAVGTMDAAGKFERGSDVLPTVNAPVFAVAPELIDKVYSSYAEGDFAIGKLSLVPSQQAKINLEAFLTRHAAILGQTGGGKSWTVASLIQKMCAFQQATIVLFDLHGEYTTTFGASADVISATDLEWFLAISSGAGGGLTAAG